MVEKCFQRVVGAAVGGILLAAGGGCDRADDPRAELRRGGIEELPGAVAQAVERGDAALLAAALRAGADPNRAGREAWPPLHRAVLDDRADLARRLVGGGADLDREGPGGATPLVLAIDRGGGELVDLLLRNGADAGVGVAGATPLALASERGEVELALRLLECGADPDERMADGEPVLHHAITAGHRDLARALIERGADPRVPGTRGDPALVLALERDWRSEASALCAGMGEAARQGTLRRLLEQQRYGLAAELAALGVAVERSELDRHLVATLASGRRQASGVLLKLGARPPREGRIAAGGRPAMLHLLLGYRWPAGGELHRACREGRGEEAGLMLVHGAVPNPAGLPFADSALTAAIERGEERLARRLVRSGAWARVPGRRGQSALALAIAQGRGGLVRAMLEHGADPNLPLRAPVDEAFLELVRGKNFAWLLARDSRVTPLMLAVDSGSLELAELLIAHGAKVHVRTRRESIWPINIAAWHGDVAMMRLLLGADPLREERYVRVDLSEQRVWVRDAAGGELFSSRISSGRKGYETRTGEFVVTNRHRQWTSTIYDSSMPFFLRLNCGDFGFHAGSVPGYPASHGCLRVPHGRAAKLYRLLQPGDRVRIDP